ncbi:hypothetical protein AWH48_11615 [Domibacillus aminovorans]|uniref:Uncharacterized protein n=1 Tax=Domibacillus aminovorans TaxID=29332 RepID=A0A177KKM9_9BACI|nr:hypothetical protein [Domibacillus aminovorans]OAH53909.1 hypothetical protein AWH48_11615 [Domibacillus aminovorans]
MPITMLGHTEMKNWLHSFIKEGRYTIAGVKYITPIYKSSITSDVITIYLYLDDSVKGTITKFELMDQKGQVFDDQPDNIAKPETNGLLISFKYTLKKL